MVTVWRDGESGRVGDGGTFLSDLLARALLAQVEGVLRLTGAKGEAHLFFSRGAPVHVSGTAVLHDFLGQILVERGHIEASVVEAAYTAQELEAQADITRRRPLGEVLHTQAGLEAEVIHTAIREQIVRRLAALMSVEGLRWTTHTAGAEVVSSIAVPIDGWATLAHLIREHAGEAELAALSDDLLGHAVRLSAPVEALSALRLQADEIDLFRHLDRPRKTHHLELAAPSRRRARTVLKTLGVVGVLERLPAAQGQPIKEVVKNVLAPSTSTPPRDEHAGGISSPPRGASASRDPAPATPPAAPSRSPSSNRSGRADSPIVAELRGVHARLGKINYYELLGLKQNAPAAELRGAYAALAKKYHPDALGTEAGPDVESLARAVSAALNDAYNTLSDTEKRGKYDTGLKTGTLVVDEAGASRALGARTKFEMAVVFLRRHDYTKARETLRLAMEMHPQNGLYKGTYAWTLFADPSNERSEAILKAATLLEEALAVSPREAALHYYYGRVLKERGDIADAATSFKRALALEPKHKDSATELRLLEHRKKSVEPNAKDKGAGSILSRFLKR